MKGSLKVKISEPSVELINAPDYKTLLTTIEAAGRTCYKSEWNDYTRAVRNYPNVLWTHQADMLASHVAGV